MQEWLGSDAATRSLEAGAALLLRVNRNKTLYGNIVKRKLTAKLEYELKKYLRIRLDAMTSQGIVKMDGVVMKKACKILEDGEPEPCGEAQGTVANRGAELRGTEPGTVAEPGGNAPGTVAGQPVIAADGDFCGQKKLGRRADHDTLPEEVKALWVRNGELYGKIKQLHATLKQMHNAIPCDRYEYLVALGELEDEYYANFAQYDAYDAASGNLPVKDLGKKISAARKYIQRGKASLEEMERGSSAYEKKAKAVRRRVEQLKGWGAEVNASLKAELAKLGV